jgi:hypothetical protein
MHVPSGWNNRCRTPLVGPLFERRLIRDFDQVGGVWRGLARSAFWVCPRYIAVPAKKTSAERRPSSTRTGFSPAKTTHFTSRSG